MRILYITTISSTMNAFFKPHIEMLVNHGHQVDLACNDANWPIDAFYENLGCEFHHIDFSRNPLSPDNIKAFRQLKKVVTKGNYDIVHCHTPNAAVITRLVCRRLRRKTGLKVFYTAHGFHFYKGAPLLNWLVFYPIEKLCSRFTDKLITINKEDFEIAQSKFKAGLTYYVPGVGIDLSRFENVQVDYAAKRQEIGVPEDAFLVLSVGELNDNKNHQVVINAIAKLQNPRVHYAIAGVGDKKGELTRLAHSLGVSEQLHLLGFRKDIPQLNSSADVFCFPSIREGLGLAAVEALACGVPVIAAENRGTRSFIENGENGFMCPHNTADEFVAALSELINDSQARTVMASSCAATVTKFSVANVLARMHDVYGLDEQ